MSDIKESLTAALGPGSVVVDEAEIAPYLTDWRGAFRGTAECVVRPRCVEDVAIVLRLARQLGAAVVPQGGNTGLAGGATPLQQPRQIVLSLNRMNAIRKVDRAGMTLQAEAGCIVGIAKQKALEIGRQLPIGFAAQDSATVGGIVSTNAGGINAVRYGTTRQLVLGVEAVLADGTILHGLRNLRKDVAGYDWKQLLVGSEGTLGVVTAVTLKLAPLPSTRTGAFVSLESPSVALALLEHMQDELGDAINAFELMSKASLQRVVTHLGGKVPGSPSEWHVLVEVADTSGDLQERLESSLAKAFEQGLILDAALACSIVQLRVFWRLREAMGEAERLSGPSVKHDVAVAVSDVPAFLFAATEAVRRIAADLEINAFGHLGDGNIHFNVLGASASSAAGMINRAVHDVILEFEGSISAEHGIGQYRVEELRESKSTAEYGLMCRIKHCLDPGGILNPGKVLPQGLSKP